MELENNEIYLYQRPRSPYWYFRFVDSSGRVIRESTKQKSRSEALVVARNRMIEYINESAEEGANSTLGEIFNLFSSPETNPRYIQAKIDGSNYLPRTATMVGQRVSLIMDILKDSHPELLDKPIGEIKKRDIILIKNSIIERYGSRTQSHVLFKSISPIFSHYVSIGVLESNPTTGIKSPKENTKEKIILLPEHISRIIASPESFPDKTVWTFFVFIASTGMRFAEALAVNKSHINGNLLSINVALKDYQGAVGLPKGNIVRTIPLSKIAMNALAEIGEDENGYYFFRYTKRLNTCREDLRKTLHEILPEDEDLVKQFKGWHNLRHTLNSNLMVEPDINPSLVAEYLAWEHQVQDPTMQKHYTHIYAKNLQVVADKIDEIYSVI